jgi:hypothetical protein
MLGTKCYRLGLGLYRKQYYAPLVLEMVCDGTTPGFTRGYSYMAPFGAFIYDIRRIIATSQMLFFFTGLERWLSTEARTLAKAVAGRFV